MACSASLGEELECGLDLLWGEVGVADEGVQRNVVGLDIEVSDDLMGGCREACQTGVAAIEESLARIGWSRDRSQGECSSDASTCSTSVVSSTVLAGGDSGASDEVDTVDPEVLGAGSILEVSADTSIVEALLGGAALHLVVSSHGGSSHSIDCLLLSLGVSESLLVLGVSCVSISLHLVGDSHLCLVLSLVVSSDLGEVCLDISAGSSQCLSVSSLLCLECSLSSIGSSLLGSVLSINGVPH